jgi:hypothetical protein
MGQDAYALLHYCYIDAEPVDKSVYTVGSGKDMQHLHVFAIKGPQDAEQPMVRAPQLLQWR